MNNSNAENRRPNILITGTPGTGKSTLSQELASLTGLNYINVGDVVREHSLHDGRDAEMDCFILNEDKLCDALEDQMSSGAGNIVDFHSCDVFPERWFDLVIVLQVPDTRILYDRLEARSGYSQKKIRENVECEIMNVLVQEAYDSYDSDIIQVLSSLTLEDMESNLSRIEEWVNNY